METANTPNRPQVAYPGPLTMQDAREFKKYAKVWRREVCGTESSAKAQLREMGIITPTGRLSKRYGG